MKDNKEPELDGTGAFGPPPIKGRGAACNPPNRFESIAYTPDAEGDPESAPKPDTQYLTDRSKSVISYNKSPDVPFEASLNPYRGCEHGCIYCYARPTHEYLGFSSGLDFETRIMVKEDAPALLRKELASPRWTPKEVAIAGVTDAYQPIERRLELTRQCLEVLLDFRNPVGIVTKNRLITRDIDLLSELAGFNAASVYISVTSLDPGLCRALEPRTSLPAQRLETIARLREAGVPVGVLVAPVIPALTDEFMLNILQAARDAGAQFAGYVVLRLPHGVKELFETWLHQHFPDRAEKVLNRIRSMRGGALDNCEFGARMCGEGPYAEEISALFHLGCRRAGLVLEGPALSTASFRRRAADGQLMLFD
ncbi:MAG: PA0069 family radical SAM protein [Candidatus Hydrogenedentota bacterium]